LGWDSALFSFTSLSAELTFGLKNWPIIHFSYTFIALKYVAMWSIKIFKPFAAEKKYKDYVVFLIIIFKICHGTGFFANL